MTFLTDVSYCMLHLPSWSSAQRSLNVSSNQVQLFYTLSRRKLPLFNNGHSMGRLISPNIQHLRNSHTMKSKVKSSWKSRALFCRRVFMTSCLKFDKKPNISSKSSMTDKTTPKKKADLKRLFNLANPEKWNLAAACGFLAVSSTVSLSVPFFIGKLVDLIYTTDKAALVTQLNSACSILLGIFLMGGMANFGRVYLINTSSQRIVKRLREALFSRIIHQEVAFFDKTKTGELVNRLSSDTSVVAQSLSQNISDGLRSSFQAIAGVGMMMYVSTKLTLISLCIVPPVAMVSIVYGRYMRKITKQLQDSLADATQVAEERISNIRTVRAFAQEKKESDMYRQGVDNVLKLSYKESLVRAGFWGFTGFSGNVMIISVFYFGGHMMLDSTMTVGDLSAFMLYAAYVGISMSGLSSFFTELNRGVAASQRVWELIDREPQIEFDNQDISHPSKPKGEITFKDVTFAYPSRPEANIFSHLDLHIPSGSLTAVVGPSGSGKSTIGGLLLRFYDPDQGNITLDGHNITELNPNWLRSHVSIVSQEPILFSTTITENIAYGAKNPSSVTTDQIFEAAKKANAFNFIKNFPDGFNTLVGERGLMLSGGQRQRIAIARAILKDPKILILDEATSALDAESEHLVQEALEGLMQGRTVLTIAHRLSTIKRADQIMVVDSGQVVENGNYATLMSLEGGLFRKLVERQTVQTPEMRFQSERFHKFIEKETAATSLPH